MQDFKRGVYAYVVKTVRAISEQLRAQRGNPDMAEAALVAALQTTSAERAVDLLVSAHGARIVLDRAQPALQLSLP
jgi:hypothetical protein